MLVQPLNLMSKTWPLLVMVAFATGCTTPPRASALSLALYKVQTLPERIANNCCEEDGSEDCEGCTRCKPHPPDLYAKLSHRYSATMDKINTKKSAEVCAFETLQAYRKQTGECLSQEFEDGFVQSYIDLADGYSGETPAVPSPYYWHARYRVPEGQARVQDWFEGYRMGALNAEQDGIGHNKIAIPMGEVQDISLNYQPVSHSFPPNSYSNQNDLQP